MQFFDSSECEWADVRLHYAGGRVRKLLGFKMKAEKEKEAIYGEGDRPIAIQSGNRKYSGEMKVHKGVLDDLNREAKLAGALDILDIAADIVVTFKQKGSRAMQTLTAINVEVSEFEYGMDQGAKNMEVTLPIVFLELKVQ